MPNPSLEGVLLLASTVVLTRNLGLEYLQNYNIYVFSCDYGIYADHLMTENAYRGQFINPSN